LHVLQETKNSQTKGWHPLLTENPWEVACIDFVGPLPPTPNGNQYILVIIDAFSRWPICIPTPNATAQVVADALYKHLFSDHGNTKCILSDRAKCFIGEALTILEARLNIRQIRTSGYQPQANQVERLNKTLHGLLVGLIHKEFKNDWDYYLPAVTFAIRASICSSTGFSPYYVMYGRDTIMPVDLIFGLEHTQEQSTPNYGHTLADRMMKVYDVVRKKQYDMAKKNKIYKDAGRRHEIQYKPGDLVLFWDPYRSDVHDVVQKYRFKWSGPHTIIEKISDIHYSVHEGEVIINFDDVTSQHKNCFTANVNRLHPVRYWSEAMPTTEPPYYGMIDDEHYALPDKNYKVTKNKMFIAEFTRGTLRTG
jgi:hypothetical protein